MDVRLGLATPHFVMGEGQACLVSGWVRVTFGGVKGLPGVSGTR
jgi:hypothetical protein